jgi:pyrroline-5-carboxylate reductase
MADAGVLNGLPRDIAYKLAAQTVLGAGKMVIDTKMHPGKLKDMVSSPGGTTIEAVASLEKDGLRSAVINAVNACTNKSKTLGKTSNEEN